MSRGIAALLLGSSHRTRAATSAGGGYLGSSLQRARAHCDKQRHTARSFR